MKKKKIMFLLLLALVIGGTLYGLQRLLVPKYMDNVVEGAFIAEYYEETAPHDLLILGDCEVYENLSPVTLWREYGITSYIRGSAQQLVCQSYYLLEDTLQYETPEVVLFNVAALQEGAQVKEAYNRMTLDGMCWSRIKYDAIKTSMMEDEHLIEYVFPLLRYHSRWKELNQDDLKYYWKRDQVSHNGYYMRADVQAAGQFPSERRKANYQFPDISYEYLDKMRLLCESRGIQLVLMKAPSLYPAWHDQWESQVREYADRYGLTYINCIEAIPEIGLDFSQDTYNGGQHLNVYGAEKLSKFMGGLLKEEFSLTDHRGEEELEAVWEKKIVFYDEMKAEQEKEFRELGYLKKFYAGEQ